MQATLWVLVLIYSPFRMTAEPRPHLGECKHEVALRVGKQAFTGAWDDMGGSTPRPVAVAGFCAPGSVVQD